MWNQSSPSIHVHVVGFPRADLLPQPLGKERARAFLSYQGLTTHGVTAKARHVSLSPLPAHPIHTTVPGTEGDGSGEQ